MAHRKTYTDAELARQRKGKARFARTAKAKRERERYLLDARTTHHIGPRDAQARNLEAEAVAEHAQACFTPFVPGRCDAHDYPISQQYPYGWSSNAGAIDGYRTPDDARKGEIVVTADADGKTVGDARKGRLTGNPDAVLIPRGPKHDEDLAHAQRQAAARNRPVLKKKAKP